MPKDLKGTRTEANLMAAFAGESQARNKYTYYASQARKDGFQHIAEIYEETAENECAHAKIWFKLLHNGMPTTEANLADAAAGEHFEWTDMYARMAREAREEGFDYIAGLFEGVGEIEKAHEARYNAMLNDVKNGTVFKQDTAVSWKCLQCGHVHVGAEAPGVCPICAHPQAYFVDIA